VAVRKKTWNLGEYGGSIGVQVNQSGTAIKIIADGGETGEFEERLFRWPLDKFKLEMYLNELTTSYYADKIIQWLMAGSWELRSNQAKITDAKLIRAYRALNRDIRLKEILNKYDVLELFPNVELIRKDPSAMKILTHIDKCFGIPLRKKTSMACDLQNAIDAYVDEIEEFLEQDASDDYRAYREVERDVDRQRG